MASAAEPSHLVFSLNLSDAGNADSGERIVQLLEQFALRQPTQVPAEHALGMGADVSPLVKALAKLNGHARASGKGLLVTIDLPRVKALELRLFFGVADLGTNQWRFGGALDGVTVVLAGDHLNDTIGSGHKSPIYDTKPLSNDEVTSLTTIWLTSTQNGFVDVALDVASQIGGNPHLLATYLHSLRHVRAGSQSVTAGVDNAELARVVQRHLLRAVADVCSDEFVSDARSAVEAWFAGPLDPIDFNAAYMFRAAKRHGIGNSVDGAPLPWIAEGRQFSRFGLESSAWAERIVSVRSPLPAHLLT